jgi:DNA-binding PadR family transcriptional regulator
VLELAILGLLTEEPLHGYELKKQLADTLGLASGVSFGSLYPALGRLEAAGAVAVAVPTATPGGGTGGKRARKVYEITAGGRALFEELLAAESTANDDDKVFALRLAFARHLPPDARLGMLERRRARLAERLQRLGARVRAGVDRLDGYARSLAEHDREATAHDLRWIERLIASERAGAGAGTAADPDRGGTPAGPPGVPGGHGGPPAGESRPGAPAPTISALRPPGHRSAARPSPAAHGRAAGTPPARATTAPAGGHGARSATHPGGPRPAAATGRARATTAPAGPHPTDGRPEEGPASTMEDPQP